MLTGLFELDRICAQITAAIQGSEWKIYATIALILTVTLLTFPPKDDPDQV